MTNGIQLNTTKLNYFMLGFESLNDFKKSFLGTWYKELTFAVAVAIGFVYFGIDTILMHVESVAYAPAKAMIMALALIIFDWAIAVYGAIISKTFETKKAQRLIPMLIVNFLVLAALYNIERFLVKPLNMDLLDGFAEVLRLFSAFYLGAVHFISAVVNAGKANLVNNKFVAFIVDYVDKHKAQVMPK